MNNKSILIIDDSKGKEFKGISTTYVDELKKKLCKKRDKFHIDVIAKDYYTTVDALKEIESNKNDYSRKNYDIIIVNLGINDCSPRILGKIMRKILWKFPEPIRGFIRIQILRRFRKLWYLIFGTRLLISENEYKDNIIKMIDNFNNSRFILMTISPTNKKLENKLKGINRNIRLFNSKLNDISDERGATISDIYGLIMKLNPEKALIDGVHYYEETCRKIADNLEKEIIVD